MAKFKDLTGEKFGKLTAIKPVGKNEQGRYLWECLCDCGSTCTVCGTSLTSEKTQSCGCLKREKTAERLTTHGQHGTHIYNIWCGMLQRCNNPNHTYYHNYGGRGIKVCERWLVFENFYEDVSQLPHFNENGYTLDRIDNNGDYEPSNVRFVKKKTQARNRRTNTFVEYEGEQMTLAEVAEKSGINANTLYGRYSRGKRGDELFKTVERKKD